RARGACMKVAIVGGTGTFGRALAKRLRALGYDVRIGSRDAERGRERAIELGTARELAEAIGETPVLCVDSELTFTDEGVVPGQEGHSLAEQVREVLSAPVASGLQSLSAAHLAADESPDEDALVC